MRLTALENGVLELTSSNDPIVADDEVLLKVKACGICGSDVPRVYNGKSYYYPIVIGHEFSGMVEESKDGKLNGKRVCVFPILPCKKCEYCKKELYANCTNYDYYGSRRDGGMQEYLSVKEENLVELPDNVSYEAGAMIEPTAVCLHAVKKARIQKEENVLIYGAGTIGVLCAMWAKDFGAQNVYLVDIDEKKLSMAENLGFKRYNGQPVDVVFEASGAGVCVNQAIDAISAFGRLVLVGNAGADMTITKENYAKILRKQLTLFGSWNSDYSQSVNDWKDSVQAISKGRINPETLITHKFSIQEGTKAFDVIQRREFYNKIMVVM